MKLSECLNAADVSVLRRIAEGYDFACSKHSKMALMQEILFHFRDSRFLAERVVNWGQRDTVVMTRLCMDARKSFSVEDVTAMFRCPPDGEALAQALAEGWLFAHTGNNGRFCYFIPDELRSVLRDAVVDKYAALVQTDIDGPLVYQDEAFCMGRDLDVMLEFIRHHEVKLTADGSMYKRSLAQLLELLEVVEETPTDTWRFGYGRRFHDYPDRLALLYDFAYQRGYVEEREDGCLLVADQARDWSTLRPLERQRQLFRFYMNLYRRPIARLPLIIQLIAAVSPDWVRSRTMLAVLDQLVQDYYYDDRDRVWQVRIVKMLTHLGVVRRGTDEDGEEWFQITKLGQQLITPDGITEADGEIDQTQRILIVQPNFDVIVTADQPLVTAELASFTDLTQAGMVRLYRISEVSMRRGLASGKSGEAWLKFLARHAQTAIPGNVERMIREWSKPASADMAHAE